MDNSKVIDNITRAYSEHIKTTLIESSTSIVVRSEQQFHLLDLFRTTQRRHLYEALVSGTGDWERFGIHCGKIDAGDRFGEYLGFLDLREHYNKSPIALALLVEPGSVREDPRAFVIRGDYGPLFGAHSFRSTVYAMQDPRTAGAMCAQMCIIMVLCMMGDRKSSIKGSFTVTYLGQLIRLAAEEKRLDDQSRGGGPQKPLSKFIEELRHRIEESNNSSPFSTFSVRGLNPLAIRDVLRQCEVGAEVIAVKHEEPTQTEDGKQSRCSISLRRALRLIEANVRASSSARRLSNLVHEVSTISNVNCIDLLVPRPCDVQLLTKDERKKRLAHFMATEASFQSIKNHIISELGDSDIKIPALATFFPSISSSDLEARDEAVKAIVNCFRLAIELQPRMPVPVVEIVCGTIVEAISIQEVHIFHVEQKIGFLIESLERIVEEVRRLAERFAIALELEPGEIYLLNDKSRIHKIMNRCSASDTLRSHVGLNVDVAHMRIANVSAGELDEFMPYLCHAHISDHPGIHTHDQFVGSWTNVEQRTGGYAPYLRLLTKRLTEESDLPFTGCIAIELEGCNRIFSIHDSIARLRHAIDIAT